MLKMVNINAAVVLLVLLTIGVACGETNSTPTYNSEAARDPSSIAAPVAQISRPNLSIAEPAPVSMGRIAGELNQSFSPLTQNSISQAGIWVTGQGTMKLQPDLVILSLGVERTAETVAEARADAARAMDAINVALRARGVDDKDIQTQSYNIWPQYEYVEVVQKGIRSNKQVVVGYIINNSSSVKIRDLASAGIIIDEVAEAGGDLTRINGIRLTVEDPLPFMKQLREAAVSDALSKANQFASLTGVSLGQLVFISESSGGTPIVRGFEERSFAAMGAPSPDTSISSGELVLNMTVQAIFGIQ